MGTAKRNRKPAIWGAISIVLVAALVFSWITALKWSGPLSGFFGYVGGGSGEGTAFRADNTTQEDIDAQAEAVSRQIIAEGTVLLKNDSALPLAAGSKVSVFGVSSAFWMTEEKVGGQTNSAFTQALTDAGLEINSTLRSFYKSSTHKNFGTGSSMGDGSSFSNWAVDEAPYSEYTEEVRASYASYNDAAFVVFSRGGSEGSDVPMYMDAQNGTHDQSYMSLSAEERELMENVSASFEKVIVVLHSSNAMDMQILRDYDVDAVIWVPGTGDAPLTELGELITGKRDFSGRLVDTYVYDSFSAPAVQNFGDFRYVTGSGELTGYSYVNYGEGIYVGYKYYETRYEDVVLGNDTTGSYVYSHTVAFPFGSGLSYNDYAWSNLSVSKPDENGTVTVTLDVTNNGTIPGKDVVELYYQAPYTEYDKENGIEKASVNLIGFAKTEQIQPGETQTGVTITFTVPDMASWDASYSHDGTTGAYVLDEGTYYVTAAKDAHQAVNNILAAKGCTGLTGSDGGEAQVDPEMTAVVLELNEPEYITQAGTGSPYSNHFEDSLLADGVYLSRTDWSVVDNGTLIYQNGKSGQGVSSVMAADGVVYTHTVSGETLEALESSGWASSGNPNDPSDTSVYAGFETGALKELSLEDLQGLAYDDPQWEQLLNQLSLSDLSALFAKGGYGTLAIESVGKPETKEYDGPARILNLYSGESTYVFPAECMMAATWNTELIAEVGNCIGDQCLLDGIAGWYAPAMNIHRTAFSGRNFEYYSEDPILSGKMAASEVQGVQAKGVYAYIKHFALNDQESNRGANGRYAAFAGEQAIREIYLKPFQLAVEEGGARGVMASMNRIGCRPAIAHYGLLTQTLRDEWGFRGIVVTDYISSLAPQDAEAGIAAGLDLQLITFSNPLSEESLGLPGVQSQLRETAHHVLYVQANSLAMNAYDYGMPVYLILLIALSTVAALYIAWAGFLVFKYSALEKKAGGQKVPLSRGDKTGAIAAGAVLAVLLLAAGVWFVIVALPALKQAFTL